MRNKAKPYLLAALPAVPYLVGVGLQVSGVTNIPLSVAVFEVAAMLAAAVSWSLWADWRLTAIFPSATMLGRVRRWNGLSIPRFGTVRTEVMAAALVMLLCNAAIVGFVSLAEKRQETARVQSAHIVQLKKFYTELGEIFHAQLPKDLSSDEYARWEAEAEKKEDEVLKWVFANMGRAAEQRLADFHDTAQVRQWTDAINPKHSVMKSATLQLQKNVRALLETDMWDRD